MGSKHLDDLTGKPFGLLTVLAIDHRDRFGSVYWRCSCQCGNTKIVRASTLKAGRFMSCDSLLCELLVHVKKTETCWLWLGASNECGYGVIRRDGKNRRATHAMWEAAHGPVPEGKWVLHHCDTPACVNPSHLFLGDHRGNMSDMVQKNRQATGQKPHLPYSVVEELRALHVAGGVTHHELAKKYGVTTRTVGRILRGECRKGH